MSEHSADAHGDREHDQDGVDERSELGDQDEIEQDERQNKPNAETAERFLHADDHASQIDAHVGGMGRVGDNVAHLCGDPAEVFAFRRYIDIRRALDLIVVELGWSLDSFCRFTTVSSVVGSGRFGARSGMSGQVERISDGGRALFVILDGKKIVIAGFTVDPVIRRDHGIRIQGRDDVVHDILLGQAELSRVYAVHVHAYAGIIHVLRDIDLAGLRSSRRLRGDFRASR